MIRAILFSLFHIRTLFLLEKCYVDNNSQQIFNDKLLQVDKKSNFGDITFFFLIMHQL